ncbi:hypothetical protein [Lacrimispora brassicae]
MQYANRTTEFAQVETYLRQGKKIVIIDAYHASGVTSFIKEKLLSAPFLQSTDVLYLDAEKEISLNEMLFAELIRSGKNMTNLQKVADKALGCREGNFFSSLVEGVNYIGSLLSYLFQTKSAAPVYTGNYPSAIEELLVPYFNECTKKRFLVIIDAVEKLPETSYHLLVKLQRCDTLQFVLIKTDSTRQYDKLENYLYSQGADLLEPVPFDRPDIKLVKELGKIYGTEVSNCQAQQIVEHNEQNIHSIIRDIRKFSQPPTKISLNDWERAIVSILDIWAIPINEDTLIEIVLCCAVFATDRETASRNAIQTLKQKGITGVNNRTWILSNHYDPLIRNVLDNKADQLIYKNIIYNYLIQKDSGKYNVELRYRLSKELRYTTIEDAKFLLRNRLITGVDITDDVLADAHLDKSCQCDCLLASIHYCRERRYEEALMWINAISIDQRTNDIQALRATLLNRTRRFEEANEALISCLKCCSAPAHQNLLGAFLISNYIHAEQMSTAKDIYNKMKDLYPNAPMHGYLIRNATSAFNEYRNDLYAIALNDFKADNDDFGYYTTLCNEGNALCKEGNYSEGLIVLDQAKAGLEHFSQTDLHIIYNNLGLCYFMLDQADNAFKYLMLAKSLGRNAMPRIFATVNLACVEAVMGNTKSALNRLDEIKSVVELHKLDRVRQKYYPNRLMVEYLHGNKDLTYLIEVAKTYPDRYTPEHTKKIINVYQRFVASPKPPQKQRWKELFSPCGLAYWYMEPLKFLPPGII